MPKLDKTVFRPLHKNRKTLAVSSVLSLAIAYVYGSRAIDTGSYFDYFLTFLALFLALKAAWWAIKFNDKE